MGQTWCLRPESTVRKTHLTMSNHTEKLRLLAHEDPELSQQNNTQLTIGIPFLTKDPYLG